MGAAIGQVLTYGVGIALSVSAIIAVVLMLGTPKGRVNAPAFLAGWVFALAAAGTVLLLAASGASASDSGAPATWVSVLQIVLGVLLLLLAVQQWGKRPRGDAKPELPSWMKSVETFTPPKAAGIGMALAVLNPKNLILIAGAAAAIAQTGTSAGGQAVALIVFVVVASLGTGTPVAVYFLMRDRSTQILGSMRSWMARESVTITVVICLIIGAKLIGDGISALAS